MADIQEALAVLRTAKAICDSGRAEMLCKAEYNLKYEDYYGFHYELCQNCFRWFDELYNEDLGLNNWILQDSHMESYFNLCRLYEGRVGLSPEENPDRAEVQRIVYTFGDGILAGYFGYELRTEIGKDRHCALLIQFYDDGSFYIESDFVLTLLRISSFFRENIEQMKDKIDNFDYRLFHCGLASGRGAAE